MKTPANGLRSSVFRLVLTVSLSGLVLCAVSALAADITWTNEAGGDFSTAGNWDPNQVPSTDADVAYFSLDNLAGSPYTVTWSQDNLTNECFRVTRGKVVFDLDGNTYVHNVGPDNSQIGASGRAEVLITNGTINAHGNVEFLHIFGDGTTVRVVNAYFQSRYFHLNASGAGSTLIIDGENSTAASWGYNQIGTSGRGTIIVTNGGTAAFGNLYIGQSVGGYGKVVVSGSGSTFSFTSGSGIAGTRTAQGGSGDMIIRDGAMALKTSTQEFNVWTNGVLTFDDGVLAMIGGGNILYNNGGVVEGDGVITGHVRNITGTVRPGGTNQAGVLTLLSGTYHNGDPDVPRAGTLEIELGGTASNQVDHLIAHDTLTCTGVLDVSFINGFSPSDGDTFDVFIGNPIAGRFEDIVLHDPAYGSIETNDLYTLGRLTYAALSVMPAPTNVVASDGAFETKVDVAWAPVPPATGYEVWRNLSNETSTATKIGGSSTTNYEDTTTTAGVTNWYWIKATNATLTSDFSDPDTGWKVAALPIPGIPANVSASDGVWMYQGRVVVTWDAASDATGYQVWRNASNESSTATQVGSTSETTFDDAGVSVGETNWYWVKATNPAHESDFSTPDTGWMAPVPPYEIQWTNEAGGDFHTPGNWNPAYVPITNNQAVFSLTSGPYTVTWSGPATNAAFKVDQGTVTFDFGGYEYHVDALVGQCLLGSASTTADLLLTNGTLRTLNQNAGNKLHVRGSGTILRVMNAQVIDMAYPYLWGDTTVLVDGTNAVFDTLGYSYFFGEVMVTNDGLLNAAAGSRMYDGGSLQVTGGDALHHVAFSIFEPDTDVRFADCDVQNHYVNAERRTPAEGHMVLDDATLSDYYVYPGYVTVYALIGTNAVLEGSGTLGFGTIENGGLVLPGGTNSAGLLISRGGVSNRADGTIEMELGGTETNQYDRIHAKGDVNRGPGTFKAGGTLVVSLINDFAPGEDTFDLFDFVTMVGTFDTVTLPPTAGAWDTNNLYVTGEITYLPPPAGTMIILR